MDVDVQNQDEPRWAKSYVRLGRYVLEDFRGGAITFGEFVLLTVLHIKANPHTGKCSVSYESLSLELQKHFSKNHINKMMLSLKRKNYISYQEHQGSRSRFLVLIEHYPRSDIKLAKPPSQQAPDECRSLQQSDSTYLAEVGQKEGVGWQKSGGASLPEEKPFFISSSTDNGRSANNDNEKERNIHSISSKPNDRYDITRFYPRSSEEQQCFEIARKLGETDMRFILSSLKAGGLHPIERAWGLIKEDRSGKIRDSRRYFNTLVRKFISDRDGHPPTP